MAVGLGKMFGFRFPKNFDYPYTSAGITEFWRRWHISLGTWFRIRLYSPGGNRAGRLKHIRNIMTVWLLTGLWHGASWNFAAWGLYYGCILLAEKFLLAPFLRRLPRVIRHLYSLFLILTGWVFFSALPFREPSAIWGPCSEAGKAGNRSGRSVSACLKSAAVCYFGCLLHAGGSQNFQPSVQEKRMDENRISVRRMRAAVFLCIARLVTETYNPFLYFRF